MGAATAAAPAASDGGKRRGGTRRRNEEEGVGGETAEAEPGQELQQPQQQQRQRQPWLAEHLSVRLFDPAWESRHGAALGLTALFKAWRQQRQHMPKAPEENEGWTRRWAEDVAGRCLCLLALDRFGDFSMGGTVAPIREVSGQLLGLVLALPTSDPSVAGEAPAEMAADLLRRALGHLQTLAAVGGSSDGGGADEEDEEGLRPWEVRHGAFVGLKYLAALPCEVRPVSPGSTQGEAARSHSLSFPSVDHTNTSRTRGRPRPPPPGLRGAARRHRRRAGSCGHHPPQPPPPPPLLLPPSPRPSRSRRRVHSPPHPPGGAPPQLSWRRRRSRSRCRRPLLPVLPPPRLQRPGPRLRLLNGHTSPSFTPGILEGRPSS